MQTPPPPSLPDVVSLTPSSGTGASGTFTATFRHPGGISKHYLGYILFLPTPNVVSFLAQGSCLIEYNRISNGMRLIDNPGTGWLGPLEGVPVAPSTAAAQQQRMHCQCRRYSVSLSGTDMIISVPVTFNAAAVTQVVGTFIQENDVNGNWTDFRQFGNWIVAGRANEARTIRCGRDAYFRRRLGVNVRGYGRSHKRYTHDQRRAHPLQHRDRRRSSLPRCVFREQHNRAY